MPTVYAWPDAFGANGFHMRVRPNIRAFASAFTSTAQVVDLTGEVWEASLTLVPGADVRKGAAIEAFLDRLKGPSNLVALWHLRRPLPLGTLRDGGGAAQWKTSSNANATWRTSSSAVATWSFVGPTLYATMLAGSNLLPLARTSGTTILTGDQIRVGGQLFRAMADYVTNAAGQALVEVQPRARADIPLGSAVVCTQPTANFRLKTTGAALRWRPGSFDTLALDFVEAP